MFKLMTLSTLVCSVLLSGCASYNSHWLSKEESLYAAENRAAWFDSQTKNATSGWRLVVNKTRSDIAFGQEDGLADAKLKLNTKAWYQPNSNYLVVQFFYPAERLPRKSKSERDLLLKLGSEGLVFNKTSVGQAIYVLDLANGIGVVHKNEYKDAVIKRPSLNYFEEKMEPGPPYRNITEFLDVTYLKAILFREPFMRGSHTYEHVNRVYLIKGKHDSSWFKFDKSMFDNLAVNASSSGDSNVPDIEQLLVDKLQMQFPAVFFDAPTKSVKFTQDPGIFAQKVQPIDKDTSRAIDEITLGVVKNKKLYEALLVMEKLRRMNK